MRALPTHPPATAGTVPDGLAVELRLPARPDAVTRARHALDALDGRVAADLLDDLRLLVSEVVANAARHVSGEDLRVRIAELPGRVRVEVLDPGPGFHAPVAEPERSDRAGAWGLWLVEELADAWGIRGGRGTCVWFELRSA